MTERNVKAAAVGLLWVVTCASHALAQDAGVPMLDASVQPPDAGSVDAAAPDAAPAAANSSVLALAVGPNVVDRDALRRALEAELGVAVEDAGGAPAYMPTLSVMSLPNGNVEVALSSRTVPRSTREFLLSAQLPEERVEMVTLIAANLIRNEAAALLPELRPAPPPPPVAASAPASPADAKLVDPCAPMPPREFGIDLWPGVGASSNERGRTTTRALSLSFAGSLHDRLQGFEIAWTGANIVRKSVCGAQVSGGANVAWGPVTGAQLALLNLIKGPLRGAQLGIVDITIGNVRGAQLGVLTLNHGRFSGAQLAVANYARSGFVGLQGSVFNLSLGEVKGAQLAVANYAGGDLHGVQGGTLNMATGNVIGAQLGVANFAGGLSGQNGPTPAGSRPEWKGAQLGVLNISAGEVHGVQLGVVNYAERSNASLGLLSIVRRGRTSIDLSGAVDSSLLFASVTHGSKYIHNILGVGLRANPNDTRFATQFGIGVRALSSRRLRLDVDLLSQNVYNNAMKTKGVSMVASVRVPLTVMLVRGLGVMVAPSYNFSIIDVDETRALDNFGSTSVQRGDPNVRGWPGVTLGVRYEFDHGV
jgi:hypothetical protein